METLFAATWSFGRLAVEEAWRYWASHRGEASNTACGDFPPLGDALLMDAVERGTAAVEMDVRVNSVGLGGIPNALGEVELDAALMEGRALRAGAVAGVCRVVPVVSLARKVMEHTPHVLLVARRPDASGIWSPLSSGGIMYACSAGGFMAETPDLGKKLLVATRNPGKLRELAELLAGVPVTLVSLTEAGIEEDVEETGSTFEENAALKATTYARLSGLPALADDSGLEVEALGGEPGPLSSRYAGEGATDADRIAFLLRKLDNIPEESWNARFRCVIAIDWPSRPVELFSGECLGRIIRTPRGSSGFGYDPVFLLPEFGKTMAELSPEEKNRVSHRSVAARKAAAALRRL